MNFPNRHVTKRTSEFSGSPPCIEYVATLLSEVIDIAPAGLDLCQETQRLLDVTWKLYTSGKMPNVFRIKYSDSMKKAIRDDQASLQLQTCCSNCDSSSHYESWWECGRPPSDSNPVWRCPVCKTVTSGTLAEEFQKLALAGSEKDRLIVQYAMLEAACESWALYSYAQLGLIKRRMLSAGVEEKRMRVIHVTGSKGKGSICRMVESILQNHGLTTGLYSTPPGLCDPRVRFESPCASEFRARYIAMSIRVNREYLRTDDFSGKGRYHKEHMIAENTNVKNRDFLTALLIFQKESVDVAIIEVCVGGRYDATNIFAKPVCVGIGLIDLDHRDRLGDTIGEIASHKAGVMKQNCPTYTVEQQEQEALSQLMLEDSRRNGSNANLHVCIPCKQVGMGLPGSHQYANAAVALALASKFLERHGHPDSETLFESFLDSAGLGQPSLFPNPEFGDSRSDPLFGSQCSFECYLQQVTEISSISRRALETTHLPMRCQWVEVTPGLEIMFDSAHTAKSVFTGISEWSARSKSFADGCKRVLLFYVAQRKPYQSIIEEIARCFAGDTLCSCDEVWSFTDPIDEADWDSKTETARRTRILNGALQAELDRTGVLSVTGFRQFDGVGECLDALLDHVSTCGKVYAFTTGSGIPARCLAEEIVRRQLVDVKVFQ